VGEVVHVLAREPEVDPRGDPLQVVGQFVADEVLDGFHVVVRRREPGVPLRFELFDHLGVLLGEVLVQRPQRGAVLRPQGQVGRVEVSDRDQILDFDADPGAHQSGLAGVR